MPTLDDPGELLGLDRSALALGRMKTCGLGCECGLLGVLAYTEERVVTVLLA